MKILPEEIKCFSLIEASNYTIPYINNSLYISYKNTDKSDNNILNDLLECKAYATALLYLNENYILDVNNGCITSENVNSFYEDCESLLTKHITIVEEVGIPLCNINGYKIFEGAGYILRGNGKKKIKESFINENAYDMKLERYIDELDNLIAGNATDAELNDFIEKIADDEELKEKDYEFLLNKAQDTRRIDENSDDIKFEYKSKSDGKFHSISKSVLIKIIAEDRDEARTLRNAEQFEEADDALLSCSRNEAFNYKGIIYDPVDYRLSKLKEDSEGTQTTDIAPKVDQEVGKSKKKKHYDILLSGLDEGLEILNKGFLKNANGQYQRGNYILVKEGDQYLAVHKDKIGGIK